VTADTTKDGRRARLRYRALLAALAALDARREADVAALALAAYRLGLGDAARTSGKNVP
jgi:hypothetical protein